MKTIGLIGGTTWVSTQDYYRYFNQKVSEKLGGYHSARCIIYSVDFQDVINYKHEGRDEAMKKLMLDAANKVAYAGAECLLLGANTMHRLAGFIQERINIPLIHIGEETARAINATGLQKVGLLGTKITMEEEFYLEKLASHKIEAIVPDEADRDFIDQSIFKEFSKEIYTESTRKEYAKIIGTLVDRGAQGIIMGCTEIPLLLRQEDYNIPLFNTTEIHAEAAVNFALE